VACVFKGDLDKAWVSLMDGREWPSKYSLEETVGILNGEKQL
jgi:hypothetical protein